MSYRVKVRKRKANIIHSADERIYKEEMETQTKRTDLWTQLRRERLGQTEKAALTYIYSCSVTSVVSNPLQPHGL